MASPSVDDHEAQAALLARLEAQFGDLDVANLLSGSSPPGTGGAAAGASAPPVDADIATCTEQQGNAAGVSAPTGRPTGLTSAAAADGIGRPAASTSEEESCDSDESSVLEEPTAEELARWQQAQYAAARQAAADASSDGGDALAAKEHGTDGGVASADDQDGPETEAETEAWVRVDEPPSLDGHESAFFGRTSSSSSSADADAGVDRSDRQGLLETLHERSDGALGGKWHPLYRSNVDGLSYVSCVHGIRGYDGPTVMLIGAVPPLGSSGGGGENNQDAMAIIGFYTQTPWSEQSTGYGGERCFLFRVNDDGNDAVQMYYPLALGDDSKPAASNTGMLGENLQNEVKPEFVQQYAPKATKSRAAQHQFLHSKSAGARPSTIEKSTVTVPPGLGVGGGPSSAPRLHLTESLDRCTALPHDEVYAPGPLLPDSFADNFGTGIHFDADVVEVWAVGGEDRIAAGLAKQRQAKSIAESQRRRNAKVDKAAFLEDFQSGLMDGGRLFEHRAQARGRHDFEVDDEDEEGHERKGGYKLPVERSNSVVEPSRTIPGTGL